MDELKIYEKKRQEANEQFTAAVKRAENKKSELFDIESKIAQLGKEQHRLESSIKEKEDLLFNIENLIDSKRAQLSESEKFHQKRISNLESTIDSMNVEYKSISTSLNSLQDQKELLDRTVADRRNEESKIQKLNEQYRILENKYNELQKKYGDVYEYVAAREFSITKNETTLNSHIQDFMKVKKRLGFYARRLERVYKKTNTPLPKDVKEAINNI